MTTETFTRVNAGASNGSAAYVASPLLTATAAALGRNTASFTGDGTTMVFSLPFPIGKLTAGDLVVKVATVTKTLVTHYTLQDNQPGVDTITFTSAPANAAAITVAEVLSKVVALDSVPDPFRPKSSNVVSVQAARLGQTSILLNKDGAATFNGNSSTMVFTLPFNIPLSDTVLVKVGGVTKTLGTDFTLTRPNTITFGSAPATGTGNITAQKQQVKTNIDDINGQEVAFTTTVTRTNS